MRSRADGMAFERDVSLGEGQYLWQDPGTTRIIKNVGTTPVEFLEFELK
jgi:mannose-6-phosphate isomerase-like protein (cupin superfamily)